MKPGNICIRAISYYRDYHIDTAIVSPSNRHPPCHILPKPTSFLQQSHIPLAQPTRCDQKLFSLIQSWNTRYTRISNLVCIWITRLNETRHRAGIALICQWI